MATIPSVTLPVTGTDVSSTGFGIPVQEAVSFLLGQGSNPHPFCWAFQNSAQPLSGSLADNPVTLAAEAKDNDNMHVVTGGSNYFFTVQTAGFYIFWAQIVFGSTSSGQDVLNIQQNGTVVIGDNTSAIAALHRVNISGPVQAALGDVISLHALSTVGNTLGGTTLGGTFMACLFLGT